MKSNQMYLRDFEHLLDLEGEERDNIFMKMHTSKEGKSQPIISMEDSHLLNTIRFNLIRKPALALQELEGRMKTDLLGDFAPPEMDDRTRRSLQLKKLDLAKEVEVKARLDQVLDTAQTMLLNRMLKWTLPYLVVAMTRDTTHLQAREILVEATGITGRIDLPQHTTYATMTAEEAAELGTGEGLVDIDDPDYDPRGFPDVQPRTWGDLDD